MSTIEIRPIATLAAAQQTALIQRALGGNSEWDWLPPALMLSVHHNGGLCLGAFDAEQVVGFAFGLISLIPSGDRIDPVAAARLKLYLRALAVAPDYQGRGIGQQLFLGVRDYALRLGLRLVTWALDPLLSQPAWLSIGKMGGISSGFQPWRASSSVAPPADFLEVEWWVTNNRVQRRTMRPRQALNLTAFLGGGGVIVNTTSLDDTDQAAPPATFLDDNGNVILVEIPHDFGRLQAHAWPLVDAWRTHVRAVLEHYFHKGYFITDCVRHRTDILPERDFYVLAHRDA